MRKFLSLVIDNLILQKRNWIVFDNTYAKAVQFPCCCKLDHKILFMALGIIHITATIAPNKLNSKSDTVATATPADTAAKAKTCIIAFQ